jgi:phosphoribosyl-ATP pyrophosphohydrolase
MVLLLKTPKKYMEIKLDEVFLEKLLDVIKSKKNSDPKLSYTAMLQSKGLDAILKKINEESTETIMAAKSETREDLIHELADLWFHCLVLLANKNLSVKDVIGELKRREGVSGIEEKNSRKK